MGCAWNADSSDELKWETLKVQKREEKPELRALDRTDAIQRAYDAEGQDGYSTETT
jgi:hypothetical protein